MSFVALLTDFGLKDGFVGALRGVILTVNPNARIVDITHQVEPFNILEGALILKAHYKYFPKGTVFLCVVDPGVGSKRLALAIKCGDYYFVGPQNGIFDLTLKEINSPILAYKIERFTLERINETFHGRDVFAPVAAHLSKGLDIQKVGTKVKYKFLLKWQDPLNKGTSIVGKVVYFDHFGNAITNVPCGKYKYAIYKGNKLKVCTHFMEAKKETLSTLCGSFGFMELFLRMGSAKDMGVRIGDRATFVFS